MQTTMNSPAAGKVIALIAALASGMGGMAQASGSTVNVAVTEVSYSSCAKQRTRLSRDEVRTTLAGLAEEVFPHAEGLADNLHLTYMILNKFDPDLAGVFDHQEYDEVAEMLRKNEAFLDMVMSKDQELAASLRPLRRSIAKARSNASVVASLARQINGAQSAFEGRASREGLVSAASRASERFSHRFG